jgi:hypothetical protein
MNFRIFFFFLVKNIIGILMGIIFIYWKHRLLGCLLGSECSSSAGMGRGLYRRGHTAGKGGCSSQRPARLLASIYL